MRERSALAGIDGLFFGLVGLVVGSVLGVPVYLQVPFDLRAVIDYCFILLVQILSRGVLLALSSLYLQLQRLWRYQWAYGGFAPEVFGPFGFSLSWCGHEDMISGSSPLFLPALTIIWNWIAHLLVACTVLSADTLDNGIGGNVRLGLQDSNWRSLIGP